MPDTDFSANGIDDILWYLRQTGRLGYYDMRADGGFSWRELPEIAPQHEFFPWIEIGTFRGSQNRSDIVS